MNSNGRRKVQLLYKRAAWRTLRMAQLAKCPACEYHRHQGIMIPATVVDHIKPHRGDTRLFHDPDNLQSLCKPCHDRHKQSQEHTGIVKGGGKDGIPFDQSHHWNREGEG